MRENERQIGQFSVKDAEVRCSFICDCKSIMHGLLQAYSRYEQWMNEIGNFFPSHRKLFMSLFLAEAVDPLLDTGPVNIDKLRKGTTRETVSEFKNIAALLKMGKTDRVYLYILL